MVPTLEIGQRVLVDRVSFRFSDPERGDIIVFKPPAGADTNTCGVRHPSDAACPEPTEERSDTNFIKRVVGVPGDRLKVVDGAVYINGRAPEGGLRPPRRRLRDLQPARGRSRSREGHYFMMGDNRGRVGGQPRVGSGPQELDHREGLHDLLAARAHRSALAAHGPEPNGPSIRPCKGSSGEKTGANLPRSCLPPCPGLLSPHVGSPEPADTTPPQPPRPGSAAGRDHSEPRSSRRRARLKRRTGTGRRLFAFDRELGCRYVAGADEAGRGSLAGPLVAAAVLFDLERLTLSDRRALARAERLQAAHGRGARGALPAGDAGRGAVGDRHALRARHRRPRASQHRTWRRCAPLCSAWPGRAPICLVDGFNVPAFGFEQRAVIDGDCRSAAIAAASVLAKVSRDRYMRRAAERHPELGLRDERGLLDARAPRGDPPERHLAAAPDVVPVDRVHAAGARGLAAARAGRGGSKRPLDMLELHDPALLVERRCRSRRT